MENKYELLFCLFEWILEWLRLKMSGNEREWEWEGEWERKFDLPSRAEEAKEYE